jgi:hypothetical protein
MDFFDECENPDNMVVTSIFYNATGMGAKTVYPYYASDVTSIVLYHKEACPSGWEPIMNRKDCEKAVKSLTNTYFKDTNKGKGSHKQCYRSANTEHEIILKFNTYRKVGADSERPIVCKKATTTGQNGECYLNGECSNKKNQGLEYKNGWVYDKYGCDNQMACNTEAQCLARAKTVYENCKNKADNPIQSIFYNAQGMGAKTVYPPNASDVTSIVRYHKEACPSGWEKITDSKDCEKAAKSLKDTSFMGTPLLDSEKPGICYRSPNDSDGIKLIFNNREDGSDPERPYVCKKATTTTTTTTTTTSATTAE